VTIVGFIFMEMIDLLGHSFVNPNISFGDRFFKF